MDVVEHAKAVIQTALETKIAGEPTIDIYKPEGLAIIIVNNLIAAGLLLTGEERIVRAGELTYDDDLAIVGWVVAPVVRSEVEPCLHPEAGTIGAESHCAHWHLAEDDDTPCCWCGSDEDDSGHCPAVTGPRCCVCGRASGSTIGCGRCEHVEVEVLP